MRYVIIGPDNKVINAVAWDGESAFDYGQNEGNQIVSVENKHYNLGWIWDGENFINPNPPVVIVPTFEDLKQKKILDLANFRWEKETGGTTFNGMPLATDPTSQTKYVGAVVAAQISPLMTLKWKLSDGTFVDLDASAITQVAMAVRSHIQACFDKEAELLALIETATNQTELDAIDITTGWPS